MGIGLFTPSRTLEVLRFGLDEEGVTGRFLKAAGVSSELGGHRLARPGVTWRSSTSTRAA